MAKVVGSLREQNMQTGIAIHQRAQYRSRREVAAVRRHKSLQLAEIVRCALLGLFRTQQDSGKALDGLLLHGDLGVRLTRRQHRLHQMFALRRCVLEPGAYFIQGSETPQADTSGINGADSDAWT